MNFLLDLQKIKKAVNVSGEIILIDEVSSTQDYIKSLMPSEVFAVIAKSQTLGKGTNNRRFYSPSGGIYLSVVVKGLKLDELHFLTPYTAVIVSNAIEKACKVKTGIKWVNDIYLSDKKVAGILTETSISGGGLDYAVIGIGINAKRQKFPHFELNLPTSLQDECLDFDVNDIVIEIVNGFLNIDKEFKDKGFMKTYTEKSVLTGKTVTAVRGDIAYKGVVKNITINGELVLDIDGEEMRFISGEVRLEK